MPLWDEPYVEVDNASSVMGENDRDEEDFKSNRVDGEEIDGSKLRYVIVQERSPVCDGGFGL